MGQGEWMFVWETYSKFQLANSGNKNSYFVQCFWGMEAIGTKSRKSQSLWHTGHHWL